MGYANNGDWFEVSWAMNNAEHGDDQIAIRQRDNLVALLVADGVTTANGRWASALLADHIGQVFDQRCGDLNCQLARAAEQFVKEVMQEAVQRTQREMAVLLHDATRGRQNSKKKSLKQLFELFIGPFRELCEHISEREKKQGLAPDKSISSQLLDPMLDALQKNEAQLTRPLLDERIQELAEKLLRGEDETAERVTARLRAALPQGDAQDWQSETTLCFALLFPEEQKGKPVVRMLTWSVGDSQIAIFSPVRNWVQHYQVDMGDKITTYVSVKNGVVGTPDIASRMLYPGEYLILASDGAHIMWTTPSGFAGVPFARLVGEFAKQSSLDTLAEQWISDQKEHRRLTDDAALIVARIRGDAVASTQ